MNSFKLINFQGQSTNLRKKKTGMFEIYPRKLFNVVEIYILYFVILLFNQKYHKKYCINGILEYQWNE